ncbi:MAG: hypothetical protein P8N51_05025 [Pseudomonadales bacterium]|nr:hypothetical protein [Pseudomonadales bacterium]MDG1444177.1 hypothetical protein [Pseudomonadales bacterium]
MPYKKGGALANFFRNATTVRGNIALGLILKFFDANILFFGKLFVTRTQLISFNQTK